MLIVRIELWSARTGQRKELGCASICNVGGSAKRGNYAVEIHRSFNNLKARKKPWRSGEVFTFPRRSLGAWDLLLRALLSTILDRNTGATRNALNGLSRPTDGVAGEDSTGSGRV